MVDLAIVGTDRVTAQGDVCNKIGTYLKALAAKDNGVPFYVALPSPTIDFTVSDGVAEIPIEERAGDEVSTMTGRTADGSIETVTIMPDGSPVANYGFDVTPARLVTGLITERGVVAADREALAAAFPGSSVAQTGDEAGGRDERHCWPGSAKFPPTAGNRRPRLRSRAAPCGFCCRSASAASANCRCRPAGAPIWSRSTARGEIWIVEIKSSVADFRADQKWLDYRMHCDRLFFATTLEVPCEIFPKDTGLIVADAFGAQIVCEAPEHKLPAATRKSMLLRFAHCAALRLQSLIDPTGPYGDVDRISAARAWRESAARCAGAC